jgi:L-aspartate oxidase
VHGANRLASNSLLDGLVFAPRAVDAIVAGKDGSEPTGVLRALEREGVRAEVPGPTHAEPIGLEALQHLMTTGAGVLRDRASLQGVLDVLPEDVSADDPDSYELRNLLAVGWSLATAALAREESRGTHTRLDYPETSSALLGRFFQEGRTLTFHPLPADVVAPSA